MLKVQQYFFIELTIFGSKILELGYMLEFLSSRVTTSNRCFSFFTPFVPEAPHRILLYGLGCCNKGVVRLIYEWWHAMLLLLYCNELYSWWTVTHPGCRSAQFCGITTWHAPGPWHVHSGRAHVGPIKNQTGTLILGVIFGGSKKDP